MKRNWIGGAFGWLWLAVVLLPIYFVLITSLKSISTYFGSNPVLPSLPLAFEIADLFGLKIENERKLEGLRRAVLSALGTAPEEAV